MFSVYFLILFYDRGGKGNLFLFLIGAVYMAFMLGVYFYRRYAKNKYGEEYDKSYFKSLFETLTIIGVIAGGLLLAYTVNYFSK
jgi:hypothetical protein